MNLLQDFKTKPFIEAIQSFFKNLNVPFNVIEVLQTDPINIIGDKKCNEIISAIYPFGIVTDAIFNQEETKITQTDLENEKYEGILLFGVELTKNNPTRTDLAEITRQINREFSQTPVVVVFYYANKLTFANAERIEYKQTFREGEKVGKISMLKDIEIDKPHRAHQDILKELGTHKAINFDELYQYWQKVLNTKKLNDDFYKELFKWYLFAKNNVSFPNDYNEETEKFISETLIRFISRMLFVWFMKEKKLINQTIFDKDELKNILKDFDETATKNIYYKAILQNLFFATLNVPIDNRKWIDGKKRNKAQIGDPLIYRYEKEFKNSEEVIENIFMKIPFLNGGLFDCLDDRENNIFTDGFTKNEKKQPQFPNYLFFGEHKNIDLSHHFADDAKEKKKWKNQNITGIIDLLNDYKFTIEENTPLEIDVALDPELLGKVFENLLASFNPETKATARKQTGSFYTPREIVNYMVDESLKQHLHTHLPNNLNEIETLFKNEVINFDDSIKKKMVEKLFDCKILDPACGSGAYPMGVLHKMVELMTILDDKNVFLKEIEGKKLDNLIAGAKTLSDTNTRTQTVEALQKQKHILEKAEYDYVRKLYIIENCIYGVDIQPIAIQISKLRFFISLLVEQNKKEDQPNFGIEPLPNMDFKLVAANTLIAPPQEDKGIGMFADQDPFFDDFERLAHDYFTLHTPESKKAKKQEIIALINEKVTEKQQQIKRQADVGKKAINIEESVKLWESYQNLFKEKAVGFFETPYFFPKVKEGFDVVIGNPPYVQLMKLNGSEIYANQNFATYSKSTDLYCLFYEKGLNLLKEKGNLNYITSNSWMRTKYGKELRILFREKSNPKILVNFEDVQIFENAVVESNILIVEKRVNQNKLKAINLGVDYNTSLNLSDFIIKNSVEIQKLDDNGWNVSEEKVIKLKSKIENESIFLGQLDYRINIGVNTGLNEVFIINEELMNNFIEQDKDNSNLIVPILRGRDLSRYNYNFSSFYLLNSHNGLKQKNILPIEVENQYPTIFEYFKKFEDKLKKRYDQGKHWTNLRNCAYLEDFSKPKIIWGELSDKAKFTYDENAYYLDATVFLMTGKNLKFILSIFNSTLAQWYFEQIATSSGMGTNRWKKYKIEQFPIKESSNDKMMLFETLVNQILSDKKVGKDTSHLEHQIDVMVYHLYELSYEEACVIDKELKEEYFERFKN